MGHESEIVDCSHTFWGTTTGCTINDCIEITCYPNDNKNGEIRITDE